MLDLKNIKIVEINNSHIKIYDLENNYLCSLKLEKDNKINAEFPPNYRSKYLKEILKVKRYLLRDNNPDLHYNKTKLALLKDIREDIKNVYAEFELYDKNYVIVDDKIILAKTKKILSDIDLCLEFSLLQIQRFHDRIKYGYEIRAILDFEKISKYQSNDTVNILKAMHKNGYIPLTKLAGNYKTKDYPFYYIFSEWIKKLL